MKLGEYKTVQARILAYAEAIGWTVAPREEAEERRAPVESLVFEHQAGSIIRRCKRVTGKPILRPLSNSRSE
jgi:hypothetical protein